LTMEALRYIGRTLKTHPGLVPLFCFCTAGTVMCAAYVTRMALKSPEACYDRTGNPEPWNKVEPTNQYKFFRVNMDYSQLKKDRPDY